MSWCGRVTCSPEQRCSWVCCKDTSAVFAFLEGQDSRSYRHVAERWHQTVCNIIFFTVVSDVLKWLHIQAKGWLNPLPPTPNFPRPSWCSSSINCRTCTGALHILPHHDIRQVPYCEWMASLVLTKARRENLIMKTRELHKRIFL